MEHLFGVTPAFKADIFTVADILSSVSHFDLKKLLTLKHFKEVEPHGKQNVVSHEPEGNVIKLFFSSSLTDSTNMLVFLFGDTFQPCIIFATLN
jgi:hypothetical protein